MTGVALARRRFAILCGASSPIRVMLVSLDDDFCPHSHGFWKKHREEWPVEWIEMGGVEYGADEMMAFLEAKGGDQTLHLALQLVATKLNLARGSDPFIVPVVEAAPSTAPTIDR